MEYTFDVLNSSRDFMGKTQLSECHFKREMQRVVTFDDNILFPTAQGIVSIIHFRFKYTESRVSIHRFVLAGYFVLISAQSLAQSTTLIFDVCLLICLSFTGQKFYWHVN